MIAPLKKLIAAAVLGAGIHAAAADPQPLVAPGAPLVLQGALEARKEASYPFVVKAGKEARLTRVKGKPGVSVDVYDAQEITPNEGVSEGDWFPVAPGPYKVTVTNTTALGSKAVGWTVAFEIRIEVR